jgi:hypothetical protein
MRTNMKRTSIWLPAIAAGAALCAGGAAVASDTLSHVLGADNLETLYATVMPDGSIKLSHEPPAQTPATETSADSAKSTDAAEAPAESAESSLEASTEQYPEI